jgi:hypothetical protein
MGLKWGSIAFVFRTPLCAVLRLFSHKNAA